MSGSNGIYQEERGPSLRELVRDMHGMMEASNKRQDRMMMAVFGDKEAGIDGLVQKVDKHQKWISLDKKVKTFGAGLAATGGTTWGFWEQIKKMFL